MTTPKVTIVGAGNVGSTAAHRLAQQGVADVFLVDVVPGRARGRALDILESGPAEGFSTRVEGADGLRGSDGSDVIVVTSGKPRGPGMSRDDLLFDNAEIVSGVVEDAVRRSPQCVLVVVTNPLDAMTWVAWQSSGLPPGRVLGMAGTLDAARFRSFLASELDAAVDDVDALVLGGHGDGMVPVARYASVGGVPVSDLIPADRLGAIVERTRHGGAEIVEFLGTSAWWAPAAAAVQVVRAILKDERAVFAVSAHLRGQYGVSDLFVGVPCRLGRAGVEAVLELPLGRDELRSFQESAASVAQAVEKLRRGRR